MTTGVLTVTHTYETIDGDEPWALSGSNFRFALQPSNGFPTKAYGQKNVICDRYAATGTNSNRYVGITNSGLSTVDEFKAALAADHAHLCYELSNPQTYQLTPTEVSTLLGANNIWADTGDVSVNYRADTTLYIDKLTSSTEEDMIADAPIASGKYFLVGNRLFLSTASIAAGATLTPGTNCTETNLAAALNALNS